MSNTLSYFIGKCGKGESFNFSRSAANNVSGNNLTTAIPFTTCNRIIIPDYTWDTRDLLGEATMYGFSENDGYVGSPPLKYLQCQGGGTLQSVINGVPGSAWSASGSAIISATDGSVLQQLTTYWPGGSHVTTRAWDLLAIGSVDEQAPAFIVDSTHMRRVFRPGPVAGIPPNYSVSLFWDISQDNGVSDWSIGMYYYSPIGEVTDTLVIENTEANAWNKTVGDVGVWSDWANEVSKVAAMEDRGDTFVWTENGVQFRLYTDTGQATGTPNHQFTITLSTQTRAYGTSDAWVDSTPIVYTTTSSGTGALNLAAVRLVCPRGYELRISEVSVTA